MASSLIFTCDSCGFSLHAWDDGNPYIEYPAGKRHYFYHPAEMEVIESVTREIVGREPTAEDIDSALKQYAGNESSFICRSCQKNTQFDPRKDPHACKHCGSMDVEDMYGMAGKKCIKCDGTFSKGEVGAIS